VRDAWIAFAALLPGVTAVSQAEELRVAATAGSYVEFNDNPRLVDGDTDAVTGIVADARLQASWGAEAWRWTLSPRLVARNYAGEYELDSRDAFVDGAVWRQTERSRYEASASYARESTLTSEFAETGTVDVNVPRETMRLQGAITHGWTERVSVNGRLAYDDVRYDGGLRSGLFDYEYRSAAGYAQYAFTERTSVNLIARFARLDVPLTGGWSREQSVGLGVDHAWNERWRMSLAAGPSYSEFRFGESNVGGSYRATLGGQWERASIEVGAERLLSPNAGQGRLQTRDALRTALTYRLSEALDVNAFVAGDRYADVGDRAQRARGTNGTLRGGVGLNWRSSPQWSWRASYTHLQRDAAGTPQGNQFIAGVNWNGWSRSTWR
jgi:hypothetical protein